MLGQIVGQSTGEQKLLMTLLDSRENKYSVTLASLSHILNSQILSSRTHISKPIWKDDQALQVVAVYTPRDGMPRRLTFCNVEKQHILVDDFDKGDYIQAELFQPDQGPRTAQNRK